MIKRRIWFAAAAVSLLIVVSGTLVYVARQPMPYTSVNEQSIPPQFVTPVGADGDPMNVDVGFPWAEQGYCAGQFQVKATETADQIRVSDVVSRTHTMGACAGIGSNGKWATTTLALREPVSNRQVVRDSDGAPMPVFALTVRLRCDDAISSVTAPGQDEVSIVNEVALPKNALQANPSGERSLDPGAKLFAKAALFVAPRANLLLNVPEEWMGKASIGWGPAATRTMALSISGCDAGDRWLVFAGGFWVAQPACIPLLVHTVTLHETVMIGVGKACPGQAEPPSGS